jgi:hypothetical protein
VSLLIAAKTPAGIVLAADSRLSVKSGAEMTYYDRAEKVWVLMPPNQHVAVGFYGKAAISLRNAASLVEEFGRANRTKLSVTAIATQLLDHLRSRWDGYGEANFTVAGYDNTSYYGYLYQLLLPDGAQPIETYGSAAVGLTFGGQSALAQRLMFGHEPGLYERLKGKLELTPKQQEVLGLELRRSHLPVPLHLMPLDDVVRLCGFLIRATARGQRYALSEQGVGGPVRTVVLERGKAARLV